MSLVPCEISVNTPILFHFHTFCQMRGMANTPQRLCHNTFKVAFSRPAQHTDKARCFSSPSSYIHQCTQKQRTDWFGVREYQTPLCCGCHSLCLSESLFVLTLTRTKSLSTTTLACIVLIQIITRQLIYIYFSWSCFPKPNNLPHNRWCSLHSRREPCLICSAAVRLWNKLIDPENGQCGVSSSYRFAVKSRKFHILYLQANLVSVSMQFICSVYIYI